MSDQNFKVPEKVVDPIGSLVPDIDVEPYKGPKPDIRLKAVSYDENMHELKVNWTATNISQELRPVIEEEPGSIVIRLKAASSTPGMAAGSALKEMVDFVRLPKVEPGGAEIKVMNGDQLVGQYAVRPVGPGSGTIV